MNRSRLTNWVVAAVIVFALLLAMLLAWLKHSYALRQGVLSTIAVASGRCRVEVRRRGWKAAMRDGGH